MASEKDWKSKYKAIVHEIEDKEAQWQELDSLLRKTIGRVSIAGRGFDKRLDEQLKLIQNLARDKKDDKLSDALDKLSRVVAALDDSPAASTPSEATVTEDITRPAVDPSALLLALLQEIQFKENQRDELKSICGDLLKLLGTGKSPKDLGPQIQKLSALINVNFGSVGTRPTDSAEPTTEQADAPVNEVLTTLLEKLSVIQGGDNSIQLTQSEESDWSQLINRIVDSISETLDKLNQEKYELEDFIVKITQQLSKISEAIAADREDQESSREDRYSLQQLMHDSMKSIEADFDNASEIGQLKNVVAKNLLQIQNGIEDFVTRADERQQTIDERNNHLVAQISAMDKKTNELQKALDENRERLLFDTLTGAGSRLSYDEKLEQELARWSRYGTSFSYVILDIDHFKRINDTYGHSAGDKALKIVANMMMKQIRKSDSLYRIGGEEFVLLLPNTSVDNAAPLVNKLREKIAQSSIHCNQQRVVLTLSAGLTEPLKDDTIKSLYERADSGLYNAKNAGRNCQFIV